MSGFSVILVPTDRPAPATEAMAVARSLARRGARVIVLPVTLKAEFGPGAGPVDDARGRPTLPSDPAYRLEYATRTGPPVDAIIKLAEEVGCELIVIGTRSPDGGEVPPLCLIAQEVLRRAACPVVCLPAHGTSAGLLAPSA